MDVHFSGHAQLAYSVDVTSMYFNISPLWCSLRRYILSIDTAEEIAEYVGDLLGGTDGKKKLFIDELVRRWRSFKQGAPENTNLISMRVSSGNLATK